MYNEFIYDLHLVQERFKCDTETSRLLKSVHNLLLVEARPEEVISELLYVLNNMQTYRDGWDDL